MVEKMDDHLKRAFAAASVPGDDPVFRARVNVAVAAAARQRRWLRAGVALLLALGAIALTPAVVTLSLALAAMVVSPAGASIALTLVLTAGWVLVRPVLR